MPNFEVTNCCFFADLRTGCLIIGYLRLFVDILLPTITIIDPEAVGRVIDIPISPDDETFVYAIYLVGAIYFVNLAFTLSLLFGVEKNKRLLVRPYIYFTGLMMMSSLYLFITNIVKTGDGPNAVVFLIGMVVQFYILLVVRSYYLKMDQPERGPAIYQEPERGPTI